MNKLTLTLIAILIISMLGAQIVALAEGCSTTSESSSGGCSGGMLGTYDEANKYGLVDTHAFHTVRGITVLNMAQGSGNVLSAETNVAALGNNQLQGQGEFNVPAGVRTTASTNGLRQYNRIAAHAFHGVFGISQINMASGEGNVLQSQVNVTVNADFMAETDVFFAGEEHPEEDS